MLALRRAPVLSRSFQLVPRHMATEREPTRDVTPHYAADRYLEGTYTERQAQMKRPTSPHVIPTAIGGEGFIYELPPVAWSSIVTRGTGVMLSVGMTGIGALRSQSRYRSMLRSSAFNCYPSLHMSTYRSIALHFRYLHRIPNI